MAQEVILLGATVAQPATDYSGQYLPLTHVEQKLKTVNYRWNPNTLAYEVETVTGGGVGTDVNVTNPSIAVTGPLTDTQLRASAVPISGALTDTQLRASAVPVSSASLPLPTGASTAANQATANASLSSIDTKLTSPLTVSGTLSTKTDLAVNAPATVTVGVASAAAVAANGARKGLYLTNTSATQRVSLAFDGTTAVLDSGITLYPQDVFWMDEYDFTNGAVAAIASAASASLGVQEYQ